MNDNNIRPLRPAPEPPDGCPKHTWCEETAPGHDSHQTNPNHYWVSATANTWSSRYDVGEGVRVPSAALRLIDEDDNNDEVRGMAIELEVCEPRSGSSHPGVDVLLTLDEAAELRDNLTKLLEFARGESAEAVR